MSYTHTGTKPVTLTNDPIDPDGKDWFFFSYGDWLRADETITASSAIIDGGTIVTDSTFIGTMVDADGNSLTNCYGVKISVDADADTVTLTHRVTTTVAGAVNTGRTDIDRTIYIPVKSL